MAWQSILSQHTQQDRHSMRQYPDDTKYLLNGHRSSAGALAKRKSDGGAMAPP